MGRPLHTRVKLENVGGRSMCRPFPVRQHGISGWPSSIQKISTLYLTRPKRRPIMGVVMKKRLLLSRSSSSLLSPNSQGEV